MTRWSGEQIFLPDTDAHSNAVLDWVSFGPQGSDLSCGRRADDPGVWEVMLPTPGEPNY